MFFKWAADEERLEEASRPTLATAGVGGSQGPDA